MVKITEDVKLTGIASAYAEEAPFDKAKEALESQGYQIISLKDNARLRIQQGADSFVSRNGNWVREGVLYVPGKGTFLTKDSSIMANPKEATVVHRNGKDYYLADEQVEQSLADSVKLSGDNIPTNRFGENLITNYAFGEVAEQYGKFLKEAGINEMPVWLAGLQDKPFARQMWFRYLGFRSGLDGGGRVLSYSVRLRGVKIGAEGTAPNSSSSIGYSPKAIANALKQLGFSGLEKTLMSKLKQ